MLLGRKLNSVQQNEFDNVDFGITCEGSEYVEMFQEMTSELCALESALYVADVMLEEKSIDGIEESEMEVMLEGVMSSMKDRLVNAMKKLAAKIKQWFESLKKYLQILFSHGKEFAKKYKSDIVKAAAKAKKFKYSIHEFKGIYTKLLDVDEFVDVDTSGVDDIRSSEKLLQQNDGKSNSEIVKKFMQENCWSGKSIDSQAEANKELREEVFGDGKEEFEDFNGGPSVQDMLKLLEGGDKVIQDLTKVEKSIISACDKTISNINKADNEAAKNNSDTYASNNPKKYSLACELVKAVANNATSLVNIQKEALKTAMKEAESTLKRLLTFRPKKEGFEAEFDGEITTESSILDTALRML